MAEAHYTTRDDLSYVADVAGKEVAARLRVTIASLTAKLADAERERDAARPVVEAAVKLVHVHPGPKILTEMQGLHRAVSAYLATSAAGEPGRHQPILRESGWVPISPTGEVDPFVADGDPLHELIEGWKWQRVERLTFASEGKAGG